MTVTTAVRSPTAVGRVDSVTVSNVVVAVVTVPTAPLLKTTEFRFAVALNPAPAITIVVALMGSPAMLFVTTGTTVATWTAVPLAIVLVVTIAVILPSTFGRVASVTVSAVVVADETVPTAPLLKTTVLRFATGSKPNPLMVIVVAVMPSPDVLLVTTGTAFATLTAAPLERLFVVTTAVRLLFAIGFVLSVTVREVAVAAVTVPTAPLFRTTVFLDGVGSKPKPVMVIVAAFPRTLLLVAVTTGVTVATCIAAPLLMLFVVTTAVRLPAVVGLVDRVTVREVAVAAVTVPTAPLLKLTVFLLAMGSNPKPLIVNVVVLAARLEVLLVTTGITLATCMAVPLAMPLVTTIAVKLPAVLGLIENVTTSEVFVAAVTVPIALLLKATRFCAAIGLKPDPLIVTVVASADWFTVRTVTTGRAFATCTAEPLLTPFVVTTAVRPPAAAGLKENVTVRVVAVAAVTVPTAPLLNTTELLAAVGSNPKPLMTSVEAFTATCAVLVVTTGITFATSMAAPLLTLFVVTTAVKLPAASGRVENVIVSVVAVASVTVPTAPLLKTTVLFAAVVSKPKPLIVNDV